MADYYQYIKYPENPNTGVKEQIEELIRQRKLQEEQNAAYREQLQTLQQAADRSKKFETDLKQEGTKTEGLSWWRRLGWWVGLGAKNDDDSDTSSLTGNQK